MANGDDVPGTDKRVTVVGAGGRRSLLLREGSGGQVYIRP